MPTNVNQHIPNVVFVLGGPGAGKGTQCERIVKEFGYVHLSAGELLRKEQLKQTKHASIIDYHIRNGSIVPVEITCELLLNAMKQKDSSCFLIDGFPRNENNVSGWNDVVGDKVNILQVLFFDCDYAECIKRCIKRGQHSQRTDDNEKSLSRRIETFKRSTIPIIKYYGEMNLLTIVDANKERDEVWNDVKNLKFWNEQK